jgi:hypothetical protein
VVRLKPWELAALVLVVLETVVLVGNASAHPPLDIMWWWWK